MKNILFDKLKLKITLTFPFFLVRKYIKSRKIKYYILIIEMRDHISFLFIDILICAVGKIAHTNFSIETAQLHDHTLL